MNKFLHQLRIARHDQVVPVILHGLQQGVHRLLPIVIAAPVGQSVSLVDKQNAAHGLLNGLTGLDGGLTHIARYQPASVHLHQMPLAENTQALVNAGHQPGHHSLARAGIARKHHMQGQIIHRQAVFLAHFLHRHQIDEAFHLFFDGIKADVLVQFFFQFLDVLRRFLLNLFRCCRSLLRFLFFLGFPGGSRGNVRRFRRGRGHLRRRRYAPQIVRDPVQIVPGHLIDNVHLQTDDFVSAIHGIYSSISAVRGMNARHG